MRSFIYVLLVLQAGSLASGRLIRSGQANVKAALRGSSKHLAALSSSVPTAAPATCATFPHCARIWEYSQRADFALYLSATSPNMNHPAYVVDFLTDYRAAVLLNAATMSCIDGWANRICDCDANARFLFYILTGVNTYNGDAATTYQSPVQLAAGATVVAGNVRAAVGLAADVFLEVIADMAVNVEEVYLFQDMFCDPYHGFVIHKHAGAAVPTFLVYSAFASNYRLHDWLNNFINVPARSVAYGNSAVMANGGTRINGVAHKSVADITAFLTAYRTLLGGLRSAQVLAVGGQEQTDYGAIWGDLDALKTPVAANAYFKVSKAPAFPVGGKDLVLEKIFDLERILCVTANGEKENLKECKNPAEMPVGLT